MIQERLGSRQYFYRRYVARPREAEDIHTTQASGRLVSDDVVIELSGSAPLATIAGTVTSWTAFPNAGAGEDVEDLAVEQGKAIVAIVVDVPVDVLARRITGRRTCPVCGEIYNIYFKPPKSDETCDLHPEVKLTIRPDDGEEKIRVRIQTFETETAPLIDYYEKSNRFHRVDGEQPTERIYREIEPRVLNGARDAA